MKRPLDPHGLLAEIGVVECRCTGCGERCELGTGTVPQGQVPACPRCSNPLRVLRLVKRVA